MKLPSDWTVTDYGGCITVIKSSNVFALDVTAKLVMKGIWRITDTFSNNSYVVDENERDNYVSKLVYLVDLIYKVSNKYYIYSEPNKKHISIQAQANALGNIPRGLVYHVKEKGGNYVVYSSDAYESNVKIIKKFKNDNLSFIDACTWLCNYVLYGEMVNVSLSDLWKNRRRSY